MRWEGPGREKERMGQRTQLRLLVTWGLLVRCSWGQHERSHVFYECDEPGKVSGNRLTTTLDYVLCKSQHDRPCLVSARNLLV